MVKAQEAEVLWDGQKRRWVVRIRVGEEVVRRPCKGDRPDMQEDALRSMAVETARDDGYELAAESVQVKR